MAGGIISDIIEAKLVDEILQITDEEAINMAHRLVKEEGLFCGISSGANVLAALKLAKSIKKGNIITVCPDSISQKNTILHKKQQNMSFKFKKMKEHP